MSVHARDLADQVTDLEARRGPTQPPPPHGVEEDEALIRPVLTTTWRFWLMGAVLATVALWGVNAYFVQLRWGLGVTGLNRPNYWGVYITNFVFFIGISHAGTLISAILRLARAEWRRSITRSAEVITVLVIFFGIGNILIDMGRPDRLANILKHGRFESPLLWDVVSVSTYLVGSTLYLFLPLIPDCAILRDRTTGLRHRFYRLLALGWQGTPRQRRILELLISIMAVVVIPIAVSVHTVVSFVFAMTIQPMWHSAIFGPYFVAGAIFSGIAALILAMALIRSVYKLGEYLKPIHFNYLGVLLLVMALLWFYFTFSEYLVTFYGGEPVHMAVWWAKISGPFALAFWTMVVCCFVIPVAILANRRTRTVKGTVVASIAVTIGMWLERWTIVVPSLSNPRLPGAEGYYFPTWVEWSIFAASAAMFALLYMIFTKLFPIVSIWEIREGREEAVSEVVERVKSYLPSPTEAPAEKPR
jgi:Ni/Fe-hydrogenase subunit HybB-like protein